MGMDGGFRGSQRVIHCRTHQNENVNLEVDLSVTNVYNRKNIFYVNMITGENVYQLPFMPALGLTFSF